MQLNCSHFEPYFIEDDEFSSSTSQYWNFSSTTCEVIAGEIATTSDVQIFGSISAGEVIISLLMLVMIVMKLMEYIAQALSNIKTKKTYLGYNGGDVEIREDY